MLGLKNTGRVGADPTCHYATRRRVQAAVESLGLPARCGFDDVLRGVERHQGVPLILREVPASLVPLCGLTLTTEVGLVVHYQPRASDNGQQNAGHELGHVVLGHELANSDTETATGSAPTELLAASLVAKLGSSTASIKDERAGYGRTVYDDQEEYEAELFAYLVRARLKKSPSKIVALF